jgi:type VI secretion system secreted protein VgrG
MSRGSFRLTIEGAPDLDVLSFDAFERFHVESRASVLACCADGTRWRLDPRALIGKKAMLELAPADATRTEPRRFHGIVDDISIASEGVTFAIVAHLMPLVDGSDHRVFLNQDSVSIASALLRERGLTLDLRVQTPPRRRVQCVQSFESVLAFVRRILADDGISLWVEHTEGEDVVVLCDDWSLCRELPGGARLPFVAEEGRLAEEAIREVEIVHSLAHDGTAVADYDPDHPAVDLGAAAGGRALAHFAYPGHHGTPSEGRTRAQLLLDEAGTEAVLARARTTCRHVAVGRVVEIAGAPHAEQNGRFRIIQVTHRGRDYQSADEVELRYEAEIIAVPEARPVRPARVRCKGFGGLETMTTTGPADHEIHTDAQGRIKARFRWDRKSAQDDTSSAWVRPLQLALSGGFFLPRVGWEVLVGFVSERATTGDTPVELGRLMNGVAPPAEVLPGKKVRGNWGTLTTPGGGKQNQLQFDDAAGAEGMNTTAAADYRERTENDKITGVTANESNTVGGSHTNTVAIQQQTVVSGAQRYSVGGNRDLTSVGVLAISAADETVSVGSTRKFHVGGDYETHCATLTRTVGAAENVVAIQETNRHVSGASSIAVGATWVEVGGLTASTGVLGASTLKASGPLSVRARNASINASVLTEKYAGAYRAKAGAKLTLKASNVKLKSGAFKAKGAHVYFKATSKITIKAGGITITITSGSITVKGKLKGDSTAVATSKESIG